MFTGCSSRNNWCSILKVLLSTPHQRVRNVSKSVLLTLLLGVKIIVSVVVSPTLKSFSLWDKGSFTELFRHIFYWPTVTCALACHSLILGVFIEFYSVIVCTEECFVYLTAVEHTPSHVYYTMNFSLSQFWLSFTLRTPLEWVLLNTVNFYFG